MSRFVMEAEHAELAVAALTVLRGLDAREADRRAKEVMFAIAWEGPDLDPETAAGEFLSQL